MPTINIIVGKGEGKNDNLDFIVNKMNSIESLISRLPRKIPAPVNRTVNRTINAKTVVKRESPLKSALKNTNKEVLGEIRKLADLMPDSHSGGG